MAETSTNSPTGGLGFDPGAPPTATSATNSPLGVPSGYKAPTHPVRVPSPFAVAGQFGATVPPYSTPETVYGTTPRADQYMPGAQWSVPLSDPQSIPQLQGQLVQAGLLNPKSVRYGTWDVTSANAYAKVLGFANAYGLNATQAMYVLISAPQLGTTKAGPTISFTNPADVETGFQNVSQNLTGQEQPTGDFVQHYHGLEAAQAHKTGENYTQAPSVQGAATQYVLNNDPSEVQAYGTASRMAELYSMLGIRG